MDCRSVQRRESIFGLYKQCISSCTSTDSVRCLFYKHVTLPYRTTMGMCSQVCFGHVSKRRAQLTDSGFWQYGSISWSTFSTWLNSFINTEHQWAIFDLDESNASRHGSQHSLGAAIVPTGAYILLQQGKAFSHSV